MPLIQLSVKEKQSWEEDAHEMGRDDDEEEEEEEVEASDAMGSTVPPGDSLVSGMKHKISLHSIPFQIFSFLEPAPPPPRLLPASPSFV